MWRTSLPAAATASSRRGRDRGHPVAVHVPRRACSARKRRLSSSRQPCHSWAVTGRSPSTAARQSPVSSTVCSTCAATAALQLVEGAWIRVMPGGGGTAGVVGSRCGSGTSVVARDRRAGAVGPVGGDGEVDHRQAGADEQQVAARAAPGSTGRRPGAATPASSGGPSRCPAASRWPARRPGDSTARRGEPTTNRSPRRSMSATSAGGVRGGRCRGTPRRSSAGLRCSRRTPRAATKSCGCALGVVVGAQPAEEVLGVAGNALIPRPGR